MTGSRAQRSRVKHLFLTLVVVASATLIASVESIGQPGTATNLDRVAPDLYDEVNAVAIDQPVKVIVTYTGGKGASFIARDTGATLLKDFRGDSLAVFQLDPSARDQQLDDIISHANTRYVRPNRSLHSTAAATGMAAAEFERGGHVRVTTGAEAVRDVKELDGTGLGIAVIDSGIAEHPDFEDANGQSRIVYRQDFTDEPIVSGSHDPYGHGTHVAGLIAGNGSMSGGEPGGPHTGIAPGATLVDLRVLRGSQLIDLRLILGTRTPD